MPAAGDWTKKAKSVFHWLRLSAWGVCLSAALFLMAATFAYVAEKEADKDGQQRADRRIVSVPDGRVRTENEGKLVCVQGVLTTPSSLKDPFFGLAVRAVKLRRKVEMFQWRQIKTADAPARYETVWWPTVLDSSQYEQEATHRNPSETPLQGAVFKAQNVKLGQFDVSGPLVDAYTGFVAFSTDRAQRFPVRLDRAYKPFRGGYFRGGSPAAPRVGDLRVRFEIAPPAPVTILARQIKGSLIPFENDSGEHTALLLPGKKSPKEMMGTGASLPKSHRVLVFRALGVAGFFLAGILGFTAITTLGQRWSAAAALTGKGSLWFGLLVCLAGYSAAGFAARWTWAWLGAFCLVVIGAWLFFKPPPETDDGEAEKWEAGAVLTGRDWMKKGARFFAAKNLNGALDAFSTAVYLDPGLAAAYFNRSIVLRKMGRQKQALLDIKKAAQLGHPKAAALLKALTARKRALKMKSKK